MATRRPRWRAPGVDPALSLAADSLVFLDQLMIVSTMKGLTSRLIACDEATLWTERVTVFDGKTGIFAEDCRVHLRRTMVTDNTVGGIDVTATSMAKLWLENSFVTNNGGAFAIRAADNSFLDIVYTGIAGNTQGQMVAPIGCVVTPPGNMVLRNSLIASTGAFTSCDQAMPEDDASNLMVVAATLQELVEMGITASAVGGGFAAEVDGPLKDRAVWRPGDTPHDVDMNFVRPTVEGPDYAGPDVP